MLINHSIQLEIILKEMLQGKNRLFPCVLQTFTAECYSPIYLNVSKDK